MTDEVWWDSVWSEYERPGPETLPTANCELRTVIDRRGQGALGMLGDLMTTGEPLMVVSADVSRRAAPLEHDLAAARFARSRWVKLSGHCDAAAAEPALDESNGTPVVLCDYATLARFPRLPERFAHLFLLDPPASAGMHSLVAAGGAEAGRSFLHLGWGEAEIEFARRVVEHEHSLRPHLAALYRSLTAAGEPEIAVQRAVLEGDGRHPRSPALAGRCLRVLTELDLARFQRSSATVSCTITIGKRVDLERSETFRACSAAGDEGLRYLSTLTSRAQSERAA
jgi:hypothetical protein